MSDLIGRHGVVAWLYNMGYPKLADIVNDKKRFPSAEPEHKKGKWIKDGHHIQCNQCGISICDKDREGDVLPKKFCPNCGTDMREGEKSED